jgi:hypothetical protein
MAITNLWATFFQWFPCSGITSGGLKIRPGFEFLADFPAYSPPAKPPVLAGLGKLTQIPLNELQGIRGHEGTEKIWSCIDPYLPIQVTPELGLECKFQGATFSGFRMQLYLHPLGFVASLQFRLSIDPGIDGFRLARLLNNMERNGRITSRAHKFKQARTVVQLLGQVRDSVAAQISVEPPRFRLADPPFCVLALGSDYGLNIDAVRNGQGGELMSALERYTSNQKADASALAEQYSVDVGYTRRPNVPSGWVLASNNGVAVYIEPGEDPKRAERARLCHHRNIVKLLGFYRLYQAFVADAGRANTDVGKDIVQHAVTALDEMRVKYSRWWIRWGTERLGLERSVKAAVERYGIARVNPPNQKTIVPPSKLNVEAVLHYKVFPTALAWAQPSLTYPLISFNLTNPTSTEVAVTLECELEDYANKRIELAHVQQRQSALVDLKFALRNPFPIFFDQRYGNFAYSASLELATGARTPLVTTGVQMALSPIDTFVFASRDAVTGKISDWSWMIAAWVSKERSELQPIVQRARALNGGAAPGYAVKGDVPTGVRAQVNALYDALKEMGIAYDDTATVYHQDAKDFAQRVRLPYRSLKDRAANCLDGSVLFASLLATIGLHPIVLLLPGHAIAGWRSENSEISDLEFIETTVLAKETFEKARELGMQKYAEVQERANQWQFTGEFTDLKEFAIPIDVEKEWTGRSVVPLPWE